MCRRPLTSPSSRPTAPSSPFSRWTRAPPPSTAPWAISASPSRRGPASTRARASNRARHGSGCPCPAERRASPPHPLFAPQVPPVGRLGAQRVLHGGAGRGGVVDELLGPPRGRGPSLRGHGGGRALAPRRLVRGAAGHRGEDLRLLPRRDPRRPRQRRRALRARPRHPDRKST